MEITIFIAFVGCVRELSRAVFGGRQYANSGRIGRPPRMHGVRKERWWSRNPCALVAVNNIPGRGEPCRRQGVFAVRSFIEFLLSLSLSLASLYTYIFFALRALNVGNDSRISLSLYLSSAEWRCQGRIPPLRDVVPNLLNVQPLEESRKLVSTELRSSRLRLRDLINWRLCAKDGKEIRIPK